MKFRFTNLTNMESREYDEKNIKGGAQAAWNAVNCIYELRKRADASEWLVWLDLIGLEFDCDTFEPERYAVEVLA